MTQTPNRCLFKAEIRWGGRRRAIWLGAALAGIGLAPLQASEPLSAFAALHLLDLQESSQAASTLVEMRGRHGQAQPERWEVIAYDPESRLLTHRYSVKANRVTDEGVSEDFYIEDLPHGFISRSKLRIDSTAVFRTLNSEAQQAGIGFDAIDYQLRCREYDSEPVWRLSAKSRDGRVVGRVDISGESGAVLRTVWFHWTGRFRGRPEVVDSALSGKPATPVAQKYRKPLFAPPGTTAPSPNLPPAPPRATVEQAGTPSPASAPVPAPVPPAANPPGDWVQPEGQYGAPKAEVSPADPVPPEVDAVPRAGRVPLPSPPTPDRPGINQASLEGAPLLPPPLPSELRKGRATTGSPPPATRPANPGRSVVTNPEADAVEVIPLPPGE